MCDVIPQRREFRVEGLRLAISYRIDKHLRIIFATVSGTFSASEMIETVRRAYGDPDYDPEFNVLSDHTKVERPVTREQLEEFVRFLKTEHRRKAPLRWAIVTKRPASFGMMRMFAVLAESIGLEVQVFREKSAAVAWLEMPRPQPESHGR